DRDKALKSADLQRQAFIEQLKRWLEEESDDRPQACLDALTSKDWGLDVLEKLVDVRTLPADDRDIAILIKTTSLEVASAAEVAGKAKALRDADKNLRKVAGTDADRARKLAMLLESALKFHEGHKSSDCPVCGTQAVLGPAWADGTREE